jgi:phosphohistidine phosphatase
MQLILLRHADANTEAATDEERRLSLKGLEQARKVAQFCEARSLKPALVLTSPVRRAHETALLVSDHLKTELVVAPWLSCGMEPETALRELAEHRAEESVMIVGHEPDFSGLIAWLLGMAGNSRLHIRKASLTLIDVPALRQAAGRLEFSLPCRLM